MIAPVQIENLQIVTERLVLRVPRLEDADDLLEYVADPEVMRWIGGAAGDRSTTVAAIERWLGQWQASGIGPFAVTLGERVLGRVGFLVWDRYTWRQSSYAEAGEHAETEIGWTLAREHWGHGYATEAARAARDWAAKERLISLIHPDNARSARVAQKLGAHPAERVTVMGDPAIVWVHPR
jgi:RimJ/RimL family protein N-acetyltransferase